MKKLLFIFLIFPIISQELIVNSFDNQSNYDDTYWQLDMSGASGLGYANCSSSNISHDNNGAVKIEYNVQNEESGVDSPNYLTFILTQNLFMIFQILMLFPFGIIMSSLLQKLIEWT